MPRVALVTGGAVRVGRAVTLGLAEAGYDVVVGYHTSRDAAHEVAQRVEELGRRALVVPGDLGREEDVRRLARTAQDRLGRVDLLVNSASSFDPARLLETDAAEWDRVHAVTLRAPFLLIRETAELLRATRGSVVNVLDLSAFQGWTEHAPHAVAKAGLHHLTRVAARALAPWVRVNAVAPGTVLPPESMGEADLERERKRTPLGRLGTPEDVVRTILFLADSPFITGEVVLVDGGRHLGF